MLRGNQSLLNRLRCESRAGPANSSSLSTSRRRRSRSTNSTTGPRLSRAANRSCHSSPHLLARISIQSEDKASPSAIRHDVSLHPPKQPDCGIMDGSGQGRMHPRTSVQISPGRIVHKRGRHLCINQQTSAVQGNSGSTHLGMRTGSRKCRTGDPGELCEASGFG